MISRYVYRAQIRKNCEKEARAGMNSAVMPPEIVTASAFLLERNLFFYFETTGAECLPDRLFPALVPCLEECPFEEEKRRFIRMYDIFHYNKPVEDRPWRGAPMGAPCGRLIRLKPEKLGSYIFYHHQRQEEYPGEGSKYGLIAIHENLLFFYSESPGYAEKAGWQGALTTRNTPLDAWHDLMNEHFEFWEDERFPAWRNDLELVYTKRCESVGTI